MSTVDLMLLGVLMQKNMNAYEMKKEMEKRSIQDWVKISSPSVYKNLVKLYKVGYVDGEIVREGEMPEKTIYSINDKGRKYFMRLMQHYSEDPGRIYVDFCAFISNLQNIDPKTGLQMVENLEENIAFRRDCINGELKKKDEVSFYAASVIDLYSKIYDIFYNWIIEFKKQYAENSKKG